MHVTLGDAARRTGLSKATISRAIKSGKLSAIPNDDGSYQIDLSELARVYDLKPGDGFAQPQMKQDETPNETGALHVELAILRERLEAAGRERSEAERLYQQAAGQIEDLRRRLDLEGEERRRLTAILTDQSRKPDPIAATPDVVATPAPVEQSPAPAPKGLRGWLHRLTG